MCYVDSMFSKEMPNILFRMFFNVLLTFPLEIRVGFELYIRFFIYLFFVAIPSLKKQVAQFLFLVITKFVCAQDCDFDPLKYNSVIECEKPNNDLNRFRGYM